MADPSGKFLGTGIGITKASKLFYKENVQFPVSGVYCLELFHAMRENAAVNGIENLGGIENIGFRIEN